MEDPEVWQDVSIEAKDLITKLLDKNPLERLNVMDALSHPWLQEVIQLQDEPSDIVLSADALNEDNHHSMTSEQID